MSWAASRPAAAGAKGSQVVVEACAPYSMIFAPVTFSTGLASSDNMRVEQSFSSTAGGSVMSLMRHAMGVVRLLAREESGQTAIAILLVFLGVFALCGLSLDAGFWYFDHRTAQNQADSAALAGIQALPSSSTGGALTDAVTWLQNNGITSGLPVLDLERLQSRWRRTIFESWLRMRYQRETRTASTTPSAFASEEILPYC